MQRSPRTPARWLASLGAALEYADFVLFVLMAPWLGAAFFPAASPAAQALQPVGLFAAGYLARPLGGLVFGSRGDRHGRKATFLRTTGLMAAATFGIGCLPVHAQVGAAAPCLLVLLRCLQGFSMGGELPGAMTFVAEHAAPGTRGRACGAVIASVSLGGLIATGLVATLTAALGADCMADWAWRVPFWLGGGLAGVSRALRRALEEPPAYLAAPRAARPLRTLLRDHGAQLTMGVAVAALGTSATIFPLYAPTYLGRLGYAMEAVYASTTAGLAYAFVVCLAAGRLIDRFGPRRFLSVAAALWALAVPTAFAALAAGSGGSLPALLAYCLLWQTGTSALTTGYWALLTAAFPVRVRYSALAVCSNAAFACSGLLPLALEPLGRRGPGPMSLPYLGIALAGGCAALLSGRVTATPSR